MFGAVVGVSAALGGRRRRFASSRRGCPLFGSPFGGRKDLLGSFLICEDGLYIWERTFCQ